MLGGNCTYGNGREKIFVVVAGCMVGDRATGQNEVFPAQGRIGARHSNRFSITDLLLIRVDHCRLDVVNFM
jgi:hypothetical protein